MGFLREIGAKDDLGDENDGCGYEQNSGRSRQNIADPGSEVQGSFRSQEDQKRNSDQGQQEQVGYKPEVMPAETPLGIGYDIEFGLIEVTIAFIFFDVFELDLWRNHDERPECQGDEQPFAAFAGILAGC